MSLSKAVSVLSLLLALAPLPAQAIPELQLYLEGAVYDADSESWWFDGAGELRLWAIGNVGAKGTISAVHLAVSYDATATPVSISLTPSSTGGVGGFVDPSVSGGATFLQTVTNGSQPLLSNGQELPNHGSFGAGVYWQEFALGDFTLTDSPIADFIDDFPSPTAQRGQINVYGVSSTGTSALHFDLYNSYEGKPKGRALFGDSHAVKAPFSHDAFGITQVLPEPAPLALMAIGIFTLILVRRLA